MLAYICEEDIDWLHQRLGVKKTSKECCWTSPADRPAARLAVRCPPHAWPAAWPAAQPGATACPPGRCPAGRAAVAGRPATQLAIPADRGGIYTRIVRVGGCTAPREARRKDPRRVAYKELLYKIFGE